MWFDFVLDILFVVWLVAGSIVTFRKWRRERTSKRLWTFLINTVVTILICKIPLNDADRIWRAKLAREFADRVVAELRDGRMPPLSPEMRSALEEMAPSYVGHQFPSQYNVEITYILGQSAEISVVFSNGEKLALNADDQRKNQFWRLPFSHTPDYAVRYLFLTTSG